MSLKTSEKAKSADRMEQQDIIEFCVNLIKKKTLNKIFLVHLSTSDTSHFQMEGAIVPSGQTVKAAYHRIIKDHHVIEKLLSNFRLAACYSFHLYETCIPVCI